MFSIDILNAALYNKEPLENLRNWLILRKDWNHRSGQFTLAENVHVLQNRGYKSLGDTGNRNKLIAAKNKAFTQSIFFTPLKPDLFRFNSQKKVLIDYKGNTKTTEYKIPESHLNNKKLFLDFCIGMYLLKHRFSNQKAAAAFNVTPRRIQLATHRNNAAGLFPKRQRKVLEIFPNKSEAFKMANDMKSHGIYISKPFQFYKTDYAIAVNTTNEYFAGVLRRKKGKFQNTGKAQQTTAKFKPWFKPLFKGKTAKSKREQLEGKLQSKVLKFNDSVYSLGDFILDHSKGLSYA